MDRERTAQSPWLKSVSRSIFPLRVESSSETYQGQLFSGEALAKAGRPFQIQVPDPQRPDRCRTLVVASLKMRQLIDLLERAAPTCGTILLNGESGCGKNLLASFIHQVSPRRGQPFVQFSAGQQPETLVESELFGHEAGAFTGAREARPGKFELAHRGTLFIDEVGDLAPAVQLKLHRFLDDQVVERVGAASHRVSDVRIIAATHRDLWSLVKEGRFREDLYYRLNVVCLRVPSLREQPEEIPAIARMLLEEISHRYERGRLEWDPIALEHLTRLPWPGNVRELRNVIEKMVILARGEVLGLEDVPELRAVTPLRPSEESTRSRFVETYQRCEGNRSAIAKEIGTSRSQVRRLIERYQLPDQGGEPRGGPPVDQGPPPVQV